MGCMGGKDPSAFPASPLDGPQRDVRGRAREAGLGPACRNPFRGIVVRSLEMQQACSEALAIVHDYRPPEPSFVPVEPRAGEGAACISCAAHFLRLAVDRGLA